MRKHSPSAEQTPSPAEAGGLDAEITAQLTVGADAVYDKDYSSSSALNAALMIYFSLVVVDKCTN